MPRQLQHVNALLLQFPEDLNLLAAKSRLLGDIGRESERLQFLEDCHRKGMRHPFLLQALAEQMAQDNRRNVETQALLHDILRRQPTNASAWWTRAGLHWDSLEREEAFECYRLCICLEDKAEGYATSYFKAARFLRREAEALEYLRRRLEWLGGRSANPFITYARALDLLERAQESIAVLEEALQKHPEDAWLVEEAIGFLCNAGHYERAEKLLQDKGSVLSEVARLYKQARIVSARGDAAAELACFRRILELQPRSERAAANIARLLNETESPQSAIAFLDSQLADNPYNLWLLHEKLGYVHSLPLGERRDLLAAMHALHPQDSRLTIAWSRLLRSEGRHEEALQLLQQAVTIDADEERVHLALGDACMDMGRHEQARAAYERAILISVDADRAFEKLLATHVSFEAKQQALQFIHSELMRQVSLGNGILEFQSLARRYLRDSEVRAFLDIAVETRPDLWRSWTALAGFLSETNQLDEALQILDQGVTRFPLLPRLWLDRGEVQRGRGDFAAAESDIRGALAINPNYSLASTRLADVLELQGKPVEALAVIEDGLRLEPLYVAHYGYRADLLWRMERRADAFDTLCRAVHIDPDYGWAWGKLPTWADELERREEVDALLRELLEKFPDSVTLWQQGAELSDDIARKHECLQRAHELAPQRSDVLLSRCDLYAEEGRIDEARALIAETYADSPKPTEVLTYEAWMTEETGRLDEAIAQLEAVVQQDPGHYNAWRLLTRWHDAAGHGEDCCRCARHCVSLYPQNATVLGMAADFLLRHLDKDNEVARRLEARDYLQRALKQDHTNLYNFLTLADLYLDENDLDDCEQLFVQVLMDGRNAYVVARHLRLALLRGRVEEALTHYRVLLQADEDSDWLLLEPLRWFREQKQKDAVWACLQQAAQDAQTPPRAARAWMACLLADDCSGRDVYTALCGVAMRPDFWREAIVHALGRDNASSAQLSPLFWNLQKSFREDGRLWSALIDYHSHHEDWAQICALTRRTLPPADATARAVYFCNVGWRMHHDWTRARELARLAEKLPRDDSHHNLMFWAQFDRALVDRTTVERDLLGALDLRELTRVERLLLEVLYVFADMPSMPDAPSSRRLHDDFRRLWRAHAELLPGELVAQARRQLWWAVLRQSQGPLWRRLARATWYVWL